MRVRVAILGGGCAGVAAAEALTATEARRRRFAVTLHQAGHRLGGKGATGRNAQHGQRIEEHGLHIWMGFYRRSFGMMRRCFEEWDAPLEAPIRTIAEAFAPSFGATMLGRRPDGSLDRWDLPLPPRPGKPWDGEGQPVDWSAFGREIWRYGRELFVRRATLTDADGRRRAGVMARLSLAVARGLLIDVLPHGEAGFDRIDDEDLRSWLVRHGADRDEVRDAPVLQGLYNLAFAFPDGRPGVGRGEVAAGAGLKSLLLIVGAYRGAPFWRMRAGMGDTIFAPLYQVLTARGVRFEFFHRVERLRLEGDTIGGIDVDEQARLREPLYHPLIDVKGQPAWPAEPLREQLVDAPEVDFERTNDRLGDLLQLERGRDFDEVVLAIPAPAQRGLAEALIAHNPRYGAMIEAGRSVATAAMQLWLRAELDTLGWNERAPLVTGLPGIFGTWGDMTDVADSEDWPEPPRSIAYFCEALADDAMGAEGKAARWLDECLTQLWPGARAADGSFRRELLLGGGEPYLRVNREPWERYVLSLPGTTRHRLAPDESGFANLFLAGDWTRTRINGGSVEAAVESGQEAARALLDRYHID